MTTEPNQEYRIRRADWHADGPTLRKLRETVFVREQGVPLELEWDGLDATAIHLLAETPDGGALGTARLLPSGQIGRMAVLSEYRGRGIGARLLAAALQAARNRGQPQPWLNAQTSAAEFYRKAGFRPEGEIFMEAGIPHRRMYWPGDSQ